MEHKSAERQQCRVNKLTYNIIMLLSPCLLENSCTLVVNHCTRLSYFRRSCGILMRLHCVQDLIAKSVDVTPSPPLTNIPRCQSFHLHFSRKRNHPPGNCGNEKGRIFGSSKSLNVAWAQFHKILSTSHSWETEKANFRIKTRLSLIIVEFSVIQRKDILHISITKEIISV